MPQPRQSQTATASRSPAPSSRNKREAILEVATDLFGREGYEHSKWADVAAAVGIGSTALYHYFESKLHCLYEIMAEALEADREKFERITKEHDDFADALAAVLQGAFELSDHEVLRNRLLVSEQVLVGVHRTSAREEEARQLARSRTRDLEFEWAAFLTRGMEQGAIPEADPRLLARAILGLYNSVLHWYRPGGDLALAEVATSTCGDALPSRGCRWTWRAQATRPRKAKAAPRARPRAADGQAATGSR